MKFTYEQEVFLGHLIRAYAIWMTLTILKGTKSLHSEKGMEFAALLSKQVIAQDIANHLGVKVVW